MTAPALPDRPAALLPFSSVIVGATRAEQLEDNCKAAGVVLPDEIVARIDEIFPGPRAL